MTDTQRTLKQMILEGIYVVDERSVAGAIVARAQVRTTVARAGFRGDGPREQSGGVGFARHPATGSLGG